MKLLIILLLVASTAIGQQATNGNVLRYVDGSVQLCPSGGTVTQTGNKGNSVTINKLCGQITTTNAALAAAAEVKFTVTNSTVSANDVPFVAIKSGGTSGSYTINVGAVADGSFDIVIGNVSTGSLSQALVINFIILKSLIQ